MGRVCDAFSQPPGSNRSRCGENAGEIIDGACSNAGRNRRCACAIRSMNSSVEKSRSASVNDAESVSGSVPASTASSPAFGVRPIGKSNGNTSKRILVRSSNRNDVNVAPGPLVHEATMFEDP